MMPGTQRGDTMAVGLVLASFRAAACDSQEGAGAAPVDAALDAAGPDAGLDGARDTAAAADRAVQSTPADAPADTRPPIPVPDTRPDAGSFVFPAPERDHDVFLSRPITARIVRFVAEQDLSTGPGLSEIELFAPGGLAPDGGVIDGSAN